MGRLRRACGNVALLAASTMVALLLVELSLRWVGYLPPAKKSAYHVPQFYYKADAVNGHNIAESFPGGPFNFQQYVRIHGAPYTVSSNNVGCRDRPFKQGQDFALLLGDSVTWGYAPLEETWGAILEDHIGMRVLKCGVGGYGPRHEQQKLQTVVAKAGRPRLVIVGYTAANDLIDDYLYPGKTVIDGYMVNKAVLTDTLRGSRRVRSEAELLAWLRSVQEPKPVGALDDAKSLLAKHSRLYNLLRKSGGLRHAISRLGLVEPPPQEGWEAYHPTTAFPWLEQAWKGHLENFRQLRVAVEAEGASMLVVLIPGPQDIYEFLRPKDDSFQLDYPYKRLGEFFEREHIAFFDLRSELRQYARQNGKPILDDQEDLYWSNDGHPNVKGNRLVGFLIARHVLEKSFVNIPQQQQQQLFHLKQLLKQTNGS